MKYLLIALMTAAVCACGPVEPVDDNGGSNVNGFGTPSPGTVVETNYNVCGSGVPTGMSIANTVWSIQTRNKDGMKEYTDMTVGMQGRAYFTKRCELKGRFLFVSGETPAVFSNSMDGTKGVLEFREFINKQEQINEEEFKMVCGLRVDTDSLNFTFYGRCLELSRPGKTQKMWMIPR